jgi:copper(I)-binding protein
VLYATITNESRHADSLDRIVTPIAGDATLHESVQSMMPSDMPGMNAMPVTSMKTLRAIQVPAGRTIRLEPGGYHVMLGDMHKGLKTGQTFVVKFHFVRAGWRAATAHVR